jgi:hypothetical protein
MPIGLFCTMGHSEDVGGYFFQCWHLRSFRLKAESSSRPYDGSTSLSAHSFTVKTNSYGSASFSALYAHICFFVTPSSSEQNDQCATRNIAFTDG